MIFWTLLLKPFKKKNIELFTFVITTLTLAYIVWQGLENQRGIAEVIKLENTSNLSLLSDYLKVNVITSSTGQIGSPVDGDFINEFSVVGYKTNWSVIPETCRGHYSGAIKTMEQLNELNTRIVALSNQAGLIFNDAQIKNSTTIGKGLLRDINRKALKLKDIFSGLIQNGCMLLGPGRNIGVKEYQFSNN